MAATDTLSITDEDIEELEGLRMEEIDADLVENDHRLPVDLVHLVLAQEVDPR